MMYLDYAANTPVDKEVLDNYIKVTNKYIANPNSSHKLGIMAKNEIDKSSSFIASYFKCNRENIIYTSGASEANNLVIKGICEYKKNLGKHIIISVLEHSSIVAPCSYLTNLGFEVTILPITSNGMVDLRELKKELRNDTILVSISTVDSELGTIQPIEEIGSILKKYPNCTFHTDATQAIGKIEVDYSNVDFITFAPHKFYGLNGVGVLVNRNNQKLISLIHGGKSTTIYRSGTPALANITSTSLALKLATSNLNTRIKYISALKKHLINFLKDKKYIHLNSVTNSIPNTINLSLININNQDVLEKLAEKEIYLSATSACSLKNSISKSVFAITNSKALASNSIRISLSHLTTKEEIDKFILIFTKICEELYENN